MTHIQEEKTLVRSNALKRIKELTSTNYAAESRSICKQIIATMPNPTAICAYYPLGTEVDIRPLLVAYMQQGIGIYLPSFSGNAFTFRQAKTLQELITGDLRIPEPPKDNKAVDITTIDYVLIPGRAFTKDCFRLGRGNGGYDTWIDNLPVKRPILAGISFECQLLTSIPSEPHDQQLDVIITAREVFKKP